jgi:hypothetical protein
MGYGLAGALIGTILIRTFVLMRKRVVGREQMGVRLNQLAGGRRALRRRRERSLTSQARPTRHSSVVPTSQSLSRLLKFSSE